VAGEYALTVSLHLAESVEVVKVIEVIKGDKEGCGAPPQNT
jgi:hypothetical protein